ncbi:SPOR domain-containing protein [Thiomicrorhabdus sp.]|uniref:SPOR domain-containing protein n=1 Tax=Thiomicrorhabdus sp. TaxID=2039724 RepID=UPI0035642AB3
MDEVSKHRLIGAAIWLTLLVIIVPGWYSQPVNFKPGGADQSEVQNSGPLVHQAYVLPSSTSQQPVSSVEAAESQAKAAVAENNNASVGDQKAVTSTREKQSVSTPPHTAQKSMVGQWLVKVAAFKELNDAKRVESLLDSDYKAWIKEFPASKTFSVRTGPYATKEAAERDKKKIDKALRTQSQIVQVK